MVMNRSHKKRHRETNKEALDRLVIPRSSIVTERKSGAGRHDSRPNRQRTRHNCNAAAIRDSAQQT
jgi:hypothetical protein